MDLGTILAIALPVIAGTVGGGGSSSKSYAGPDDYANRSNSSGFLSGDLGEMIGRGAKAYVASRTDAAGNTAPAFVAPTPRTNRSVAELTRGNPTRGVPMAQSQNPVFNMPQVQSAYSVLAQNASNSQVQRLLRDYMVTPNISGGRVNMAVKQTEVGKKRV